MMVRFPRDSRLAEDNLNGTAKTQLGQGSRRRRYGSGLETLNDGSCRIGTRDDD